MGENEAAFQYFAGKSLGFLLQGKESKKRNVIRISDHDFLLVRNERQPASTWKASGNYLFNVFTFYGFYSGYRCAIDQKSCQMSMNEYE